MRGGREYGGSSHGGSAHGGDASVRGGAALQAAAAAPPPPAAAPQQAKRVDSAQDEEGRAPAVAGKQQLEDVLGLAPIRVRGEH